MLSLPDILASTDLPSIPAIPLELLNIRKNPDSSIHDFTDVIRNDPAICSRLITLANSSAFATRFEAQTIDRAVQLLGPPIVIGTAFSVTLAENSFNDSEQKKQFDAFWTQSLVQAIAAKNIGKLLTNKPNGDFFLTGLLLDIGQLALLNVVPDQYLDVLSTSDSFQRPLTEIEQEKLGLDHVVVGVKLMQSWNFPEELITPLESHHRPLNVLQTPNEVSIQLIAAFSAQVGDYFCSSRRVDAFLQLKKAAQTQLKYDQQQLEELLSQISEQIAEIGDIFQIPAGSFKSAADILNLVNKELAQIVMDEALANATLRNQAVSGKKEREELTEQANKDPLTGIYNRRFLQEHLSQTIMQSARSGTEVAILFIDIDHFKKINDTYGHSFGDEVLCSISNVLKSSLRDADVLSRYGGEEFIIIVHEPSEEGLHVLGERLRAIIDEHEFRFHDRTVKVTISVGGSIAISDRKGSKLAERLIAAADTAMYDAKQSGRNCFRIQSLLDRSEQLINKGVFKLRFSHWLLQKEVIDADTLLKFMQNLTPPKIVLGQLAIQQGLLTQQQVDQVLKRQLDTNELFGQAAISLGFISAEQIIELLAIQKENPWEIAAELVRKFIITPLESRKLLEEYQQELQFLQFKEESGKSNS